MPNDLYSLDASFPKFTGRESEKQRVGAIYDYLIQLQQTLRYCLQNLGSDNFNDTELEIIGNTIREPVYLRLTGVEKETAYIALEASKLTSRMETAEGNISEFEQSAQELSVRVEEAEGYITELIADTDGLFARVGNAEGNVTALTQKVDSFTLSVTNGKDSSTIKLMAGDAEISSQNIKFEGVVTFTDGEDGYSVIDGGMLYSSNIRGEQLGIVEREGHGTIVDPAGISFRVGKFTNNGAQLDYASILLGERFSIRTYELVDISVYAAGNLLLNAGGETNIGASGKSVNLNGNVYVNGKLIS